MLPHRGTREAGRERPPLPPPSNLTQLPPCLSAVLLRAAEIKAAHSRGDGVRGGGMPEKGRASQPRCSPPPGGLETPKFWAGSPGPGEAWGRVAVHSAEGGFVCSRRPAPHANWFCRATLPGFLTAPSQRYQTEVMQSFCLTSLSGYVCLSHTHRKLPLPQNKPVKVQAQEWELLYAGQGTDRLGSRWF